MGYKLLSNPLSYHANPIKPSATTRLLGSLLATGAALANLLTHMTSDGPQLMIREKQSDID